MATLYYNRQNFEVDSEELDLMLLMLSDYRKKGLSYQGAVTELAFDLEKEGRPKSDALKLAVCVKRIHSGEVAACN